MSDESTPEQVGYDHIVPLVAAQSYGGPYDDHAFAAGWSTGETWARLAIARDLDAATVGPITARTALLRQLDLVGMHYGYTMTSEIGEALPEWSMVTFTREADRV